MKKLIAFLTAIAMMCVLFAGCTPAEENTLAPETTVSSTPATGEAGENAENETTAATLPVDATQPVTEATVSTDATEATAPATVPTEATSPKDPEVGVEVEDPNAPVEGSQEIDFDALLNASK